MSRSVPDDDVMNDQQAMDRKPVEATGTRGAARTMHAPRNMPVAEIASDRRRRGYRPAETPAGEVESDKPTNRGPGALFRLFQRSRGGKKLRKAANAALGEEK